MSLARVPDRVAKNPGATVTNDNGVSTANLVALSWFCQDRLIFGAIVSTLSHDIVALISQTMTTEETWNVLATTYANPSRCHSKQIKSHLSQITHSTQSITSYM
ncbi:hypothetical protein Lal_00020960 [Lupinus albus]|nr:hypothetical protein Lal_00020960 [Lupinus albus]